MRAVNILPDEYREIYSVDLQKDSKIAIIINVLALIIAVAMIVPMHFAVPIFSAFTAESNLIECIALILLIVVYMILHEMVHGIAMKICGTKKIKYGFTGLYAFAGSDDYYDKKSYIFIALAPVVLWGVVIAVINIFVPLSWFWVVYFIQVMNLSGAAGDLFVTVKFIKMPKDILIKDSGVGMTVYSAVK